MITAKSNCCKYLEEIAWLLLDCRVLIVYSMSGLILNPSISSNTGGFCLCVKSFVILSFYFGCTLILCFVPFRQVVLICYFSSTSCFQGVDPLAVFQNTSLYFVYILVGRHVSVKPNLMQDKPHTVTHTCTLVY